MFKIFHIRLFLRRFWRGVYILYTMAGFFIVNRLSVRRHLAFLIPKKYKRNGTVLSMPERMRIVIEELGPTFVKFGQILADRPDIISEKLRLELKKLQSMAEPISHTLAMQLIEEELGAPIGKYFIEICNDQCIGAASIGQVYKAKLKSGEEVVIKIQRPDIEDKIELDLHLLKYLAQQVVEEYPGLTVVDIVGFVDEFGETLKREMNYVSEAANITRFGEMFKEVPYCKIPKVYLELSTPRLLVLEYIHGINPDSVTELEQKGLDPKEIAVNGTNILLIMIFKHGFFHADPHAGNLFIQPGNRIALIDFGMVGTLKPSHMQFLAGFTQGLATNDARVITDALLVLCDKKFFGDRDDLEFLVGDMLTRHGTFSYEKMNFSYILNESIKILHKYDLHIPASIYLLLKALASIENFGSKLYPGISLPEIIKPYATELVMKQYSPSAIGHDVYDILKDYINLVKDFPSEMNEILYRMKQGKLIFEIKFDDKTAFLKSAKGMGGLFLITLLIGCMLAASVAMSIWGKTPWIGDLMLGVSAFLCFWHLLRILFKVSF